MFKSAAYSTYMPIVEKKAIKRGLKLSKGELQYATEYAVILFAQGYADSTINRRLNKMLNNAV
jgi:hypothetical protein